MLLSGNQAQVTQALTTLLKDLENDLTVAASLAGTIANYSADFAMQLSDAAKQAGATAAALGDFLYDMISLSAVLVKGNISDTYAITKDSPQLATVTGQDQTLSAVLSIPQVNAVGYSNDAKINTGNSSGDPQKSLSNISALLGITFVAFAAVLISFLTVRARYRNLRDTKTKWSGARVQ
jgi:hypothetical protein